MTKSSKTIVVLGATSAIAKALCRLHGDAGDHLILCARDEIKLATVNQDLASRYSVKVDSVVVDFADDASCGGLMDEVAGHSKAVDVWYVFYGVLPDQAACESSVEATRQAVQINFTSVIEILTSVAIIVENEGKGSIVAVSSVAGDRGRGSNYVYGTAKGGVTLFLQGLRNRLHKSGGHVLTVKPGFVSTPMTAHLDRSGPLWATPEKVAMDIYRAVRKRKDVLYTPWFWGGIMMIIRGIPEVVFKRLGL